VVSFTPRPHYPRGKSSRYSLYRRVGGPQSRSGRRGEVKILAPPVLKLRLLRPPARSQRLYRLSYPGCEVLINTCLIVLARAVMSLTVKYVAHLTLEIHCSGDKKILSPFELRSTKPYEFIEMVLINLSDWVCMLISCV
jgi:hypothetical protein